MINICFDDSTCGAMKHGLREKSTFIYSGLCYGKIHPKFFDETRKSRIDRIFSFCSQRERNKIFKEEKKRFEDLINQIKCDKEARIWYANNASDKCGLYHFIHALQGIDCKIYAVEMPGNIGFRDEDWEKSWGEAEPEDFEECLPLTRLIDAEERDELSQKWEKLIAENSDLRVIISGEVSSVPVDYLDDKIMEQAPTDGEFKSGYLIGMALGKTAHYLSCGFAEWRVEELIKKGALIMVDKNEGPAHWNMYILRRAYSRDHLQNQAYI